MIILLKKYKYKKYALLCFNIVFYLFSGIEGLIVIVLFGMITFFGAGYLEKHKNRWTTGLIIAISLLPLFMFKYINFLCHDILGMEQIITFSDIIAPLGISYFTFQGVGYLIDVYRDKYKSEKSFMDYMIFLSLFTCISAGPINRADKMLEQIKRYDYVDFDYERCVEGFRYILLGVMLKVMISTRMAQVATGTYSHIQDVSGLALLIASVCFTIQIFCDFCGYSFMAYGLSKVLGFEVIQNFNRPYSSKSITEFWRRWHISLSSWLRDYVYFSLGGSRCSKLRTYFNLMVTFTLSGLWHGAALNYIFWGALNGFLLVIEKVTGLYKVGITRLSRILHWAITIILINITWIFFKVPSVKQGFYVIYKIITDTIRSVYRLSSVDSVLSLCADMGVTISDFLCVIVSGLMYLYFELSICRYDNPTLYFRHNNSLVRWVKYVVFIVLIFTIGATGNAGDFIYAKF